ncbi:MAG: hypothetical protein A2660_02535 [Candidatus Doudnabacteria bacterium RIFCSPHIGHO2_01_FULL_45_18]|uniref:Glycosyl transferase n=1 Tax=Candidatus Doudnabacteria bacterium RIFCSPHIGHO2_01_FULL_45_18 TaxID=1817823 RepID=A0A1F5NRD1_9BACT|nr:MAG: hypothetical protein A2660_02535 [Candidatus Doudnabacteria bacterium RIFCSPHIGHO2_01_FULL_45_18]
MKVDIAGVLIDNITKREALDQIDNFVQSDSPHYIVTPYSEQIIFALQDKEYLQVLNKSSLALPDGIGILWAAKFLSLKGNWLASVWQIIYTGAAIIFNPTYVRSVIREQIPGNRLAYDLAKLAADNNYSLAFVGGQDNVAAQAAYELKKLYPSVKINLALSGRPFDNQIIKEISESNSDILIIAHSPPHQERWIAENLSKLDVKLAIGLGGTFDYLAGKRAVRPDFMHQMGLEWLWRLITQPWRIKRIWNAVPVFIWKIYKYKIIK